MIDQGELAAARVDAEELLPDTATILDAVPTSDGAGGETVVYVPRAQQVACRISPVNRADGETGVRGGRVSDRTTHTVTLPAGTVIGEDDRLRVGGVTYEITVVRTRSLELVRRLEVREVE